MRWWDSGVSCVCLCASSPTRAWRQLDGWVTWLIVIQTENWSAISSFSDPLLMLSAIRSWNFLHSDTGRRSEWLCRAELILKSNAGVDPNQFTTGITQCAQWPTIKKTTNTEINMIPFTNNQKLKTSYPANVSCEFNWIYHADFRLKSKISYLFEIIKRCRNFFKKLKLLKFLLLPKKSELPKLFKGLFFSPPVRLWPCL